MAFENKEQKKCPIGAVHSKPAVQKECKKVALSPNPNPFITEISQNRNVDYFCFGQRDQKLGCGVFILKSTGENLETEYYTGSLFQHLANNLKVWRNIFPLPIPAVSDDFVTRKNIFFKSFLSIDPILVGKTTGLALALPHMAMKNNLIIPSNCRRSELCWHLTGGSTLLCCNLMGF